MSDRKGRKEIGLGVYSEFLSKGKPKCLSIGTNSALADYIMDLHNILIVDDEVGNLNALQRTLRREYNIFSATNGKDALAIVEQNDIALIVTDHCMPGISGVEFLEKTMRKYPNTIRIILTAYADERRLMDAISKGHIYDCITKPWEPRQVRAIVRKGIEAYEVTCGSEDQICRISD